MDLTLSSACNTASGSNEINMAKAEENCIYNLTGTIRRWETWFYSHTVCGPVDTCRIILDLPKTEIRPLIFNL